MYVLNDKLKTLIKSAHLPPYILKKIAKKIGGWGATKIRSRFTKEEDARGKKWKPLSRHTPIIYQRTTGRKHRGKAGQASGRLFELIRSKNFWTTRTTKGSIRVTFGANLKGKNADKLTYLQRKSAPHKVFGKPVGTKPARRVMEFSGKEKKELRGIVIGMIEKYRATLVRRKLPRKRSHTLVIPFHF